MSGSISGPFFIIFRKFILLSHGNIVLLYVYNKLFWLYRAFFTPTIAHINKISYLCIVNSKLRPWRKDQRVDI